DVNLIELPIRLCFVNSRFENFSDPRELATDVDERFRRANGMGADGNALYEEMRIEFHDLTIFECARLTLVRVTDEIHGPRIILWQEGPLRAGREARAAAPADVRFLHFMDDIFR